MNVRYLLLLLVLLPLTSRAGEGVLIFKANLWQKDEFARTMPYKAIRKFPTVHNVTDLKGEKTRVSSDLVLKDFPFPGPKQLANLREEEQVKALEAMVAEWRAARRRFPSSIKYLKPQIAAIEEEIARFRAGEVKWEGEWMTRANFEERKRQLATERERLMDKLAKEAKEMAMNASEWQAMDDAGRQKAREARRAALLAQITAAEQRRVDAEIQRQASIMAARAKLSPYERITTDETIVPPGLSEEQTASYRKTLEDLNAALKPVRHEIAFTREEQKFAIRTPKLLHVVAPKELSPEVRIIEPPEGIDDPPTLEIATHDHRDVILSYGKGEEPPTRNSLLVLPATSEMDLDSIRDLLSKLITTASTQKKDPAPQGPGAPSDTDMPEPAEAEKPPTSKPVPAEAR